MQKPASSHKPFFRTPVPHPLLKKKRAGHLSRNTRSQSITMISNAMRRITTHSRKFECWIPDLVGQHRVGLPDHIDLRLTLSLHWPLSGS